MAIVGGHAAGPPLQLAAKDAETLAEQYPERRYRSVLARRFPAPGPGARFGEAQLAHSDHARRSGNLAFHVDRYPPNSPTSRLSLEGRYTFTSSMIDNGHLRVRTSDGRDGRGLKRIRVDELPCKVLWPRVDPPVRNGRRGEISISLFDAAVDLNPYQIEAALFAFRSPLSKGVLLADEVGLGKTIEAGLVLCQCWAERRRKLLVICPASLRKQWSMELSEKFHLPSVILDSASYREAIREGSASPFLAHGVVIVSMNFASRLAGEMQLVAWDLVVIDEAHKLRGAYRASNKMGQAIRTAIADRRKLLLTATPLQNSLLELYGLSTLIDEHLFGDLAAFRTQYCSKDGDLDGLKERLRSFCYRTLRSQVLEYVKYTERRPITRPFTPADSEQQLYEAVSAFLRRDDTYSIPRRQRELTTMILRKLLSSSSQAVAGTLERIRQRLLDLKARSHTGAALPEGDGLAEKLIEEDELNSELLDEPANGGELPVGDLPPLPAPVDLKKLDSEIAELDRFVHWARSIQIDAKTRALLTALQIGFDEMEKIGALRKAVVFTESRRTQEYLRNFLEANGYGGRIVLFNGTNTGPDVDRIYREWEHVNSPLGRLKGRTGDP